MSCKLYDSEAIYPAVADVALEPSRRSSRRPNSVRSDALGDPHHHFETFARRSRLAPCTTVRNILLRKMFPNQLPLLVGYACKTLLLRGPYVLHDFAVGSSSPHWKEVDRNAGAPRSVGLRTAPQSHQPHRPSGFRADARDTPPGDPESMVLALPPGG